MTNPDALRSVQGVWKRRFNREISRTEAEQILEGCLELYPLIHDLRIETKLCWDFAKDVVIDPPTPKRKQR